MLKLVESQTDAKILLLKPHIYGVFINDLKTMQPNNLN